MLDTPDPAGLAEFYCALLGWQVTQHDDDWVTIRGAAARGWRFQLAPDLVPPSWPDPTFRSSPTSTHRAELDEGEGGCSPSARKTGQPPGRPRQFRGTCSIRAPVLL